MDYSTTEVDPHDVSTRIPRSVFDVDGYECSTVLSTTDVQAASTSPFVAMQIASQFSRNAARAEAAADFRKLRADHITGEIINERMAKGETGAQAKAYAAGTDAVYRLLNESRELMLCAQLCEANARFLEGMANGLLMVTGQPQQAEA